jgi:uncharacterized protein (TIGR02391 family)
MTLTNEQREVIRIVVTRFLNLREPTSRRQLLHKFKNKAALDDLLKRSFFSVLRNDFYSPQPLAFQYCGDESCLARAREATELALRVLQNLDEAHPEKETADFTFQEYIAHAARICDRPDETLLTLGLNLANSFNIFSMSASHADGLHTPTAFRLVEDIVTLNPAQAWDEHIKRVDPPATAQITSPPVKIAPHEFGFDAANRVSVRNRRAAVRPIGAYAYHPEIRRVSERLCLEGNFRQAVLDAFIHVIATVKERTGLKNNQGVAYDGDDLMNRAFCPDNRTPPVLFNPFRTDADRDEQRGIWNLFKGIVGLRNFKAHIVSDFDDPNRAHEYLALASLLMRLLDMAIQATRAAVPPNISQTAPNP